MKRAVWLDRACQVCGKPIRVAEYTVRQGGGKYCSKQCQGIAARGALRTAAKGAWAERRRRARERAETEQLAAPVSPSATSRRCLACSGMFASAWIGNRICNRCQASDTWRGSLPSHAVVR